MKILALETSSDACSVALSINGDVRQLYEIAPRQHGERIIPMVDQLLNEAAFTLNELDAIAYGRGPGSFIGLRIASGVTQGLAFAADLPVIPVSSLAAIAQRCVDSSRQASLQLQQEPQILVAVDARMEEIYWAHYQYNIDSAVVQLQGMEHVARPENLPVFKQQHMVGAGSGWQVYAQTLAASTGITTFVEDLLPDAASVAAIAVTSAKQGATVQAHQAQPIYVRDKVANKPA